MALLFRGQVAQALNIISCYYTLTSVLGTLAMAYTVFTLSIKIYITIGLNVMSVAGFIVLEALRKKGKLE